MEMSRTEKKRKEKELFLVDLTYEEEIIGKI